MRPRQHCDGVVATTVAQAACRQELDLIRGGGNSGLHLKGGAGEGARTTINTISGVK